MDILLIGIFIIQREVQLQIFRRQINGAETSSELIVCINALVVEVVLEETSLVFVEESVENANCEEIR